MSNKRLFLAPALAAAVFFFAAGVANAQGVLFVKDGKVGIGEPNPSGLPLTLKTDDGTGAGFKVETADPPAGDITDRTWFFQQNAVTGAFLISNFAGGQSQFQVYPNDGNNNPPFTFVVRRGGIGLGTFDVPFNTLYVADGKLTSAEAWSTRSSKRYKDNIKPLDGALEKVEALQGVSYNLKSTGQGQIGFIAEDVGKVLPELVQFEENGVDALTLDYDKMTALLVEAVKDQQQQIKELQRQLAER